MNDIKPEVGFGIMMLKDGKILLGKRNDDAKKADSELHGEGTWTMPGGKLHFQESFEQGAEREVLEETGIKLNKAKVIALNNDLAKDAHFVTIGLFSENFEGEAKVMEPEEITQWKWFDINNIPANLFPPSKKLLENYKSKLFYKEEISEEKMKIEEQIEKIKQEIQPYFKEVNPSHDFTHTERVMSLALRIGKKENADLEIINLAALLHDIGRKQQDSSNGKICHAEAGAKIARDILKKHRYNDEIINKIIHCIETHRFRGNKIPESKEAKVLYDADKLDSIGAIGIGRAFFFAAQLNALIHIPNISVEDTKEYSKEDTANREFFAKLINVKDKMLTEEGKKIAEERHQFMVSFFNRLDKEYIGEI